MVIYILDVRPLIDHLQSNSPAVKQVWYTDNVTGAAPCNELYAWLDYHLEHGKGFGYHPNARKTQLVVKAQFLEKV